MTSTRWSICHRGCARRSPIRSRSSTGAGPRRSRPAGPLVDLGAGDPRDETAPLIREALRDAVTPVSSYPRAAGLPELREAIAAWVARRFGVTLDPDAHILPTLGSKEPIFSLAQALLDPEAGKHLVTVTTPGYTIPERGARYAGGDVARLSLTEDRRSCRTSTPSTPRPGTGPRRSG